MRFLILLCVSCKLFGSSFDYVRPSSVEEIASLNTNLFVEGFVSVVSGQLVLSETDLYVKGAQDLALKRSYTPPQIFGRYSEKREVDRLILGKELLQLNAKGWSVLPHLLAGYNQNSSYFQVKDPQGFVLEFKIDGDRGVLQTSSYGCSNLSGETPNSAADIRNTELWITEDQIKIIAPNGIQRIYFKQSPQRYRLEKEILTNGKVIQYKYDEQRLIELYSSDISGKHIYASINKVGTHHYQGSDGRESYLAYEMREISGKYKEKNYTQKAEYRFPVMTRASNTSYSNAVGYNERTQLNFYDAKSYPISCSYYPNSEEVSRIQTFSTPSGSTSFSYDSPIAGEKEGSTTVLHPNGAKTVYRFNKNLLLSAIENWFENKLYNQKIFSYDAKQHLQIVETKDGNGKLLLSKHYECDPSGNPILETHKGDFGTFWIKRKFSKNRLLSEKREDGLSVEYTYLNDTHLITSKTILECDRSMRRTLYSYDEANNLIEECEEGQTVTKYLLYQEGPHLHKVEWKETWDVEGNLIGKTHFFYDQWRNVSQEDYYGSDEQFAYSIEKLYDEKGNLLNETNPLKQEAMYRYNNRSYCVWEVPFSNYLTIEREFDAKGRLIQLRENDHITQFAYNTSDDLIKKINYLGLTTNYVYHPVHRKPIF